MRIKGPVCTNTCNLVGGWRVVEGAGVGVGWGLTGTVTAGARH